MLFIHKGFCSFPTKAGKIIPSLLLKEYNERQLANKSVPLCVSVLAGYYEALL